MDIPNVEAISLLHELIKTRLMLLFIITSAILRHAFKIFEELQLGMDVYRLFVNVLVKQIR